MNSRTGNFAILFMCLLAIMLLTALGIWQLERRIWKLALIDQVNHRIHAAPVPAPKDWSNINAKDDAYRRVVVSGQYLNDKETLVQAVTERGPGFWVMTPLRTDDGDIILINRGFVPADHPDAATHQSGPVSVTGLLRMTESKGGFLRNNNPQAGYWYSRDVSAIALSHGINRVAPYFIDADNVAGFGEFPIGGLTVVRFHNNHLVYALTWFTLALMLAIGIILNSRSRKP